MAYIVVMISWIYTYLQTQPGIYAKYVQFLTCQPYLNKSVFFKKKKTIGNIKEIIFQVSYQIL